LSASSNKSLPARVVIVKSRERRDGGDLKEKIELERCITPRTLPISEAKLSERNSLIVNVPNELTYDSNRTFSIDPNDLGANDSGKE
jgi:hypothetical protein